jgi:hypothetical protein
MQCIVLSVWGLGIKLYPPPQTQTQTELLNQYIAKTNSGLNMSESLPSKNKPKKMVNRNIAITVGIICIMLLAVLIYSVEMIENGNNQISELQNENLLLERQTVELGAIVNLSKTPDLWKWNENISLAPMTSYSWNYSTSYAGYVFLQADANQGSTYNIHLRLVWSYKNGVVNYDNTTNGLLVCAILPCPNVTITLSNFDPATEFSGTLHFIYTY